MARIRSIPKERASMILRTLYDAAEKQFGSTPNFVMSMAHRPELLLTFWNFYRELWTGGVVDVKTKELAALRTVHLTGCEYCLKQHTASGQRFGLSPEQVAALRRDDWSGAGLFDDREQAVVRLAEKLTREPGSVTDDDIQALRKWYGESHLAELNLLIGTMNLISRFCQCFAVDLEETETSRREPA
jgi:uncharacterized peroxidase-related enzyme